MSNTESSDSRRRYDTSSGPSKSATTAPTATTSSGSSGWRRSARQAKRPEGFFSERSQEVRNEALRKQLEDELPFRLKTKRRYSETSPEQSIRGRSSREKKQKRGEGPPREPEPKPLDLEAFVADLETDYTERWNRVKPKPKLGPKNIWGPVSTPIFERENAPRGWTTDEPDLDPNDLDAQIQRCKERIEDMIMPQSYHWKLKDLLALRRGQREIMATYPGLGLDVNRRLKSLEATLESLERDGDEFNLSSNIKAIIAAYSSGRLGWCDGLITYWNQGVQLCKPRPYVTDEFRYLHDEYNGLETGFQVEGLFGVGPPGQNFGVVDFGTYPNDSSNKWHSFVETKLDLRIPQSYNRASQPMQFDFIDDTGANCMTIYAGDLESMMTANPYAAVAGPYSLPRIMGVVQMTLADSSTVPQLIRELEINLYDDRLARHLGVNWDSIPVIINPGNYVVNGQRRARLNGPWLRWRYWVASAPHFMGIRCFGYDPSDPPYLNMEKIHREGVPRALPITWTMDRIENHPELNPNLPAGRL